MADLFPAVQSSSVGGSRAFQRRFRLSKKRALFAMEYAVDGNGAAAAVRAGYSERTARQTAYRLLTNVYILQAVEVAFAERMERLQITADDVVRRLIHLGFTDINAFASWSSNRITLKDLDQVPPEKLAALAEVQETTQGLRIRLRDPLPALALLARHTGVIPTAGTRESTVEHARATYERTVTEKWDLKALTPEQLEQWDEIISTILGGEATPDA